MTRKVILVITTTISVVLAFFHMYTSTAGVLEPLLQRPIHLALILGLVFLIYPFRKGQKNGWGGILLALLGMISVGYVAYFYEDIIQRPAMPTTADIVFGIIAIVLLFEATRRTNGWALPILAALFILYAFNGPSMPQSISHRGYGVIDMIYYMFLSTEGIFGTALGVSATYIYLFIFFGAILQKTGMGEFFNDIAMAGLGHMSGGPAKVAVVGSGMMGTINGSAIANVVTTGAFTIPLMKKIGYRPSFAGAVESVSSVGGYLMPPIMASTAFIMAEMLRIPYAEILKAAIIPAILYYLAIILMVHFRSGKRDIKGLPKSELPKLKDVLRKRGHLIIPIALLVYLLIRGYTPLYAAFFSIIAAIVVSTFSKETRMSVSDLVDAMRLAAKNTVAVAIACGIVGIIMGVSTLTGLGLRASSAIVEIGGGSLLLTLVLAMLASIILGMGLPSIPTYILTATMAAPALIQLGVLPIAAHMFVFYFGALANITPPVALAAFAAAGIAGSSPMRTGLAAMKLALAGFIIPFIFAYSPEMLLQDTAWYMAVKILITGVAGVLALSLAVEGYGLSRANMLQRSLAIVAALCLITTQWQTDVIGIGLLIIIAFWQWRVHKADRMSPTFATDSS